MKAANKSKEERSYKLMLLMAFKRMAVCSLLSKTMQCGKICQNESKAWNLFTCLHQVVSLRFPS